MNKRGWCCSSSAWSAIEGSLVLGGLAAYQVSKPGYCEKLSCLRPQALSKTLAQTPSKPKAVSRGLLRLAGSSRISGRIEPANLIVQALRNANALS